MKDLNLSDLVELAHKRGFKVSISLSPNELAQVASDNADWFDQLTHDAAELLDCKNEPSVILESIKLHVWLVRNLKDIGVKYPVAQAVEENLAALNKLPKFSLNPQPKKDQDE